LRADLAEKIGVNQSALTHWWKGESNPSIEKIPEIARILGVTIGHLFGEEGEASTHDSATVVVSDESSTGGLDCTEKLNYHEIIKTHASTIATLSNTNATHASAILTLSNTNATQSGTIDKQTDLLTSQTRIIEVMVVDNKATKK
jgi:transcriptional regulator with XRE-family HTH domain